MSATPADIKPKFQSGFVDNAVPGQLGPSEWNESRLASGGVTGDLYMRDTASTTGASWLTPDFESSGDVAAGDAATLSSANAHSDANDTTTLTSANTHADAGDATTLATANTHADSGDSATLSAANSHSDVNDATTLGAANSHADAGDTTTLNSAKSYADTKDTATLNSAKSYADTGDSTTLASAKSYADTKDAATLTSANAHSDAGLAGLFSGSPTGGIALSTGSAMAWLADVAVGSYLRSGGVGVAPVWSALTLPNAATLGDVLIATGTNALGSLADVATGSVLTSGGVGVAPAWSATPTVTTLTLVDTTLSRNAAGKLTLTGTTPMLQLGGTTNAFPALKRSGTSVQIRLADDSANASIIATTVFLGASLSAGNPIIFVANPTISSGFGTSPSVVTPNGTAAFTITVGTGGSASSGVIGMPAATTGWNCYVTDLTAAAAHTTIATVQTASTTTSVTLESQTKSTGVATAWAAGSILRVSCFAY